MKKIIYSNPEQSTLNRYYRKYSDSASKRGIRFEITIEQFTEIVKKDCVYCGASPVKKTYKGGKKALERYSNHCYINGIDRENNTIGYEYANCVPCCKDCNFLKGRFSSEEFFARVKLIHERRLANEDTKNLSRVRTEDQS